MVLGSCPELSHVPRQIVGCDVPLDARLPAVREIAHVDEVVLCEQVGERQGNRPCAQHVAGQGATDSDPLDERLAEIRITIDPLALEPH